MKNYIAPSARLIMFDAEESVAITATSTVSPDEGLSNQRHRSASSVIWGFDDEVVTEY